MDWKYKHFHQERVFPAPRDLVSEAARAFMAESLGWQVTDTPDGFTAQGYSFSHRAIANLQIQSAAGGASSESGTRVAVELLVERVDLQSNGIDLRLRIEGLTSLCSELRGAGAHQEAA